ncbi:MAG: kelch repeat-containing protein [Deltaproteobacteria bacterium]|nr:kelch repeat-containing protein [Deltaproteobacteria bacterium]
MFARRFWGLVLMMTVLGCGRDFGLPESDSAIQSVVVTPAVARAGVELQLEVYSVGSPPLAVEARILGETFVDDGLGGDGVWRAHYTAVGLEPEDSEVRVDVEARTEAGVIPAVAWTRFDFTPPALLEVLPESHLLESEGESVAVDFVFSEALSGAPTITVLGRSLACTQTTRQRWSCPVTLEVGDPAGWLKAQVDASDPAGNELSVMAGLLVSIDRASAPVTPTLSLISQTPSPATAGQPVELVLAGEVLLDAPPEVTIAGRSVECVGCDRDAWSFTYRFLPLALDHGPEGGEGGVTLSADASSRQGVAAHLDAEVELDLLGPQVTQITAVRDRVLADETLTLLLSFHEPVASSFFTIQGRVVSCSFTDPLSAVCTYRTTGSESEGPQRLEVRAIDALGNESFLLVDTGVSFDFACQQLASRAFVVGSTVRPTAFFAEAGVFEPGSTVALAHIEGGAPFQSVTAEADGSVLETAMPATVDRFVWFRAIDVHGHACPWARSSQRFLSEFSPVDTGSSVNQVITEVMGARSLSLPAYTLDRGIGAGTPKLGSAQLTRLASKDGQTVVTGEPALAPAQWTNHGDLPGAPGTINSGPLTWDPVHRRVMRYWTGGGYAEIDRWDGTAWSSFDYFPSPPSLHNWGWGITTSHQEGNVFVLGGHSGGLPLSDFLLYDGWGYIDLQHPYQPSGRYFPGLAYHEHSRRLLLFGGWEPDGTGTRPNGETWLFGEGTWSRLDPLTPPSARIGPALVTDTRSGDIYLFGGSDPSGALDDTWRFDGSSWQELFPTSRPPARTLAGATFHAGMEKVILFGGYDDPQRLGDLWSFDGTTWTPESFPGGTLPALNQPGLAYDFRRGALVLYGGYLSSTSTNRDLWELSPTALYPQVLLQLQMPSFVEASSVATLELTARGEVTRAGTGTLGLEVELWDETAGRWRSMVVSSGVDAGQGLFSYIVPLNEEILSRQASPWAFVLIRPRGPATQAGGASLELDSIRMQIDTY